MGRQVLSTRSCPRRPGRDESSRRHVSRAPAAMLAVAAHEVDEAWLADWLSQRVRLG